MRNLKIKNKVLYLLELIYITLPLILFIFGWTKLHIAIICCIVGVFCYVRTFCGITKEKDNVIEIKPWVLIFGCLLLIFVGFSCSWGRWVEQTGDYAKHNTILADLTNRSWPIYYRNGNEHSMLTYYLGQYTLPAITGKLFNSFRISEITLFLWSVIGIILVWLHITSSLRLHNPVKQIGCIVIMVFFFLAVYFANKICFITHLTRGVIMANSDWFLFYPDLGIHIQYSSNYTLLNWVFPQVIVCWITVLLLIDFKNDIKYYVPLMLPSIFFGILTFFGILIMAISYAVFILIVNRSILTWLKQIFSIENILCSITLGSILILYYFGNIFSEKPDSLSFYLSPVIPITFLLFYITCVLPFPICLMKWYFKDFLFVTSSVILIILPLFHFGFFNDFMMRTSIPALFVMMYNIIDLFNKKLKIPFKIKRMIKSTSKNSSKKIFKTTFFKNFINTDSLCIAIIMIFLIGGAAKPIINMFINITHTHIPVSSKILTWNSAETYANRSIKTDSLDILYNYYTYDIDDNFFYKYIARVQDTVPDENKIN